MTATHLLWRAVYALGLALCAATVLVPHYPPMVDLPQHVAQVATMDRMLRGVYPFSDQFEIVWFTPYWLGYLLVWVTSGVLGYVWAAKVVTAASIISFVLLCVRLRIYVKAPRVFDWMFLTTPFGFAYQWGMLNFLVAAPLGVLAIHEFLLYRNGHRRGWQIGALMLLLAFAHVLTMAFVSAICALLATAREHSWKTYLRRVLPLLSPLPPLMLWLLVLRQASSTGGGPWDLGWHRGLQLLPDMLSLSNDPGGLLVATVLLGCPWLLARPTMEVHKVAPFAFYVLFMLFAPNYFMGNFFTYNRFGIFGLILYVIAFGAATPLVGRGTTVARSVMAALIPLTTLAETGNLLSSHIDHDQEARSFRRVIDRAEPGERLLGLIAGRYGSSFDTPVFLHYASWYQAERNGVADFSFAWWPGMNVTYKKDKRPLADESLLWHPGSFDWDEHQANQYRYLLVKGDEFFERRLMERYRERVTLLVRAGDWRLFETMHHEPRGVDPTSP